MHFSGIELYNFGIYKGQHNIELIDQRKKKNITLVGGMNGRGKTTILDAIFLCLYGRKAIEYIVGKKEAYNKVLKDRINKSADDKTTHVKITMVMDDDEDTIISITRTWSQTDSKITTDLIVEKNGIEDTYLSENWEYYVEELIPYGIAKFFFFDNEKISQIADDDAFDKIKDSIKSVMGVTTVETLCAHIEKIRKDKNASLKKTSSPALTKESEELSTAIEECETKIRNLYAQRAALVPELEKTTNKLEETEQSFWKKGGNLGLNHDDIIRDQHELKDKESALKEQAIALASNPATPICLCKLRVELGIGSSVIERSHERHCRSVRCHCTEVRSSFDGVLVRLHLKQIEIPILARHTVCRCDYGDLVSAADSTLTDGCCSGSRCSHRHKAYKYHAERCPESQFFLHYIPPQ